MDRIHTYSCDTAGWTEFISLFRPGFRLQIDRPMFDYWLGVLPPIFINEVIDYMPEREGEPVKVDFGFAEGNEKIVLFWREDEKYFCQQSNKINY